MKYQVKIQQVKFHGFKYKVSVYKEAPKLIEVDYSWAYTRWGARKEAKKIIARYESLPKVVEEYTL